MSITRMMLLLLWGGLFAIVSITAFAQSITPNPLGIHDVKVFFIGIFMGVQAFLNLYSVSKDE